MECGFCNFKDKHLVIKDGKYWIVFPAESQLQIGRSIAVLKRHAEFFEDLTSNEILELQEMVKEIKSALKKIFKPDWFNVMQLGNMERHLHFHLVPRYARSVNYKGRIFKDERYGKMVSDEWKPESRNFLEDLAKEIKKSL